MSFLNKSNPNSDAEVTEKIALNNRLKAMIEVNEAIAGVLNTDDVLNMITSKLVSVIGVSFAVIFVWDEITESISLKSITVPPIVLAAIESSLGKSIKSVSYSAKEERNLKNYYLKCLLENQVLKTSDLYDLSYPTLAREPTMLIQGLIGMKLSVSIPLVIKGTKLGVLGIIWKENTLSEDDESSVMAFANQVSTTIYNAQLFERVNNQVTLLTRKNEDLTSLYNLASNVSKSLDPLRVAQSAVSSLPQDKLMAGAMISRYLPDKQYVVPLAVSENQLAYAAQKLIGDFSQYGLDLNDDKAQNNLIVKSIKTLTPQSSNNITDFLQPAVTAQFINQLVKLLNIKSVVVYPLIIRDQVLGAITFFIKDKSAEEIDSSQHQLFQTYANQIVIALENAQLFLRSQQIQAQLEKAYKELDAARKYERDMVDIMGHELRTPMSIVRNALLMMDTTIKFNNPDLMEKIKKYVEIGVDSARREVSLIETLLSATKADGKGFQLLFEKIDLTDVVRNSFLAFQREATRKGLDLRYERPEQQVAVFTDRTRIQEIADNFINNAVKYTIQGTVIVRVYEKGGFGYLSVIDSGIGISEPDVKKLGNKFFRARQYNDGEVHEGLPAERLEIVRPGGTGLGLYVTFNLIKILDGKLTLQSKLGTGSSFTVGLPIYTNQQAKQVERKPEIQEELKEETE